MAEAGKFTREIVEALEQGMREQGMQWADLQKKTGVTWATVRHWKLGQAAPRVDTVLIALEAVGYELKVLPKDIGRLYTEEEVEKVKFGACVDGLNGLCPDNVLISDFV